MSRFAAALWLTLAFCGAALAGAQEDCNQNRDWNLAIRSCTLIIEGRAKGDKAAAYVNRANAPGHSEDQSIADCNRAIELNPNYAEGYKQRAVAYSLKGDHDQAIADYSRAIELNPNYAEAYNGRGGQYSVWKDELDRGIADYNRVIELDPKYVSNWDYMEAYEYRASAYRKRGDYDRAIADISRAIELSPEYTSLYDDRAKAFIAKGDYDRAIADANRLIELKDRTGGYTMRGDAYRHKGNYDSAIADYNRAIELKWTSALRGRGLVYYLKGDYDQALADFNDALRREPKWTYARSGRGLVLMAMGKTEAALEDFNEALQLPIKPTEAFWGRGQIYELQGLRSLALADYKKALELISVLPDDKEAQNKARARLIVLEPTQGQAQTAAAPRKPQAAGRRVALVIGNSAYKSVAPLANPKNDAAAVAGELTRLGFEVIEKRDLGVAAMRKVLGEFEDKTGGSDWALVYYSGHGMELDGHNWLIPVDAELLRSTDAPDEAIALDRVLARLNAASTLRIVILDACRNNPFMARMVMNRASTRAVARGLAPVEPGHGEVVFYAARDGNVALDGKGSNSPFAEALVKHMDQEGIELGWFFREVTSSVLAATGNQQEPFVYGRLPAERYYFRPTK